MSFATKTATASVTIPFLDSDADGYSNAAEISAATDPNNAASYPGKTKAIQDHQCRGGCTETYVKMEKHVIIYYEVTYEDQEGVEQTGNVSVELGSGPKAAIAESLNFSEDHIVKVNEKMGWELVFERGMPLIGQHAEQFFPTPSPGYNFHQMTKHPKDVLDSSETNVEEHGIYRTTTSVKIYKLTASWQEIEE